MIPKHRVFIKKIKKIAQVTLVDFEDNYLTCEIEIDDGIYQEFELNFDEVDFMQSTGLKDTNSVEIFEGDVVKCYIVTEKGEYEYVGVVCLKDFAFVIVDEKDTYDPLWNYKSGFVDIETEIEIIGNIHANPELVEVKDD